MSKYLAGLINVEKKTKDVASSGTTFDSSGFLIPLNIIAQGDTAITRDGGAARIKSVEMRLSGTIHGSATNTFIRFILVEHGFVDGTQPDVTDVLSTASYLSAYAHLKNKGFKILWDHTVRLSADGKDSFQLKKYVPTDLKQHYAANTGDAWASINSGVHSLLVISSEATNTPTVAYNVRSMFVDN